MAERRFDTLSLVVGFLALVGSVLVLLDRSGAVHVDAAAAAAALLVALGAAGVARAALRLLPGAGPDSDS